MVDKYEAKKFVASIIGEEYVIPTLGVWDRFDDIDFSTLPKQFVLKCTHDSGGLVIVRDKSKVDIEAAKAKIERSLKRNYFWQSREWPYKNVKPRIIAEKYMSDGNHANLPVYKIFCFNGLPRIIQTIQNDKQKNETIDYFDTNWQLLNLRQNFPNSKTPLCCPSTSLEMQKIAQALAANYSFIRIDLYTIEGKPMFSEYTFFSDAGMAKFDPPEWDKTLGDWLVLPNLQ